MYKFSPVNIDLKEQKDVVIEYTKEKEYVDNLLKIAIISILN